GSRLRVFQATPSTPMDPEPKLHHGKVWTNANVVTTRRGKSIERPLTPHVPLNRPSMIHTVARPKIPNSKPRAHQTSGTRVGMIVLSANRVNTPLKATHSNRRATRVLTLRGAFRLGVFTEASLPDMFESIPHAEFELTMACQADL